MLVSTDSARKHSQASKEMKHVPHKHIYCECPYALPYTCRLACDSRRTMQHANLPPQGVATAAMHSLNSDIIASTLPGT